jgi:hypothetical protein
VLGEGGLLAEIHGAEPEADPAWCAQYQTTVRRNQWKSAHNVALQYRARSPSPQLYQWFTPRAHASTVEDRSKAKTGIFDGSHL